MLELFEAWGYIITSWANFFFTLKFPDGVSLGGFYVAVAILAILIDFIFSPIRRERPGATVSEIKQFQKGG